MAGRISSPNSTAANQDDPGGRKSSRASGPAAGDAANGPASRKAAHSERPARAGAGSIGERLVRLEGIMRGENPLDRNRALLAFIDQLGPGDFETAVAQFRKMGITDSRFGEYALLLAAWAKADPLAALTYAKANTGGRFATNTILASWAAADPEAAIRWAETNHQGDGANPYLSGIIRAIAGTDPARATQLLTGMPRSQERGEALDAMMPHFIAQGAVATRAWIAGLTDDSLRDGAMMRSAAELAATDPAGTASWLVANPGQASQRALDDVYAVWAGQDARAAESSIAALASADDRSNALRGLITNIAVADPRAALSLMNRFPNDVTDQVVQQFVWHAFNSDPAAAVNQIARIADEGQRNQMYGRVVGSWLDQDATAAAAWMRTNPLPAAVQQRLNRPR